MGTGLLTNIVRFTFLFCHLFITITPLTAGPTSVGEAALVQHSGLQPSRGVTVADIITMTIPGDPDYFAGGDLGSRVAQFSPDGKTFVILLRKGNLARNTNDYSVLLWNVDSALKAAQPQELVRMSSSSNRPAIEQITWLNDNRTILFLGERPGELRQLYSFNIQTHALAKLTEHPTSLISYSVTPDAKEIVYKADGPPVGFFEDRRTRTEGVTVSRQHLLDLLINRREPSLELFFKQRGQVARKLRPAGRMEADSLWVSPNGRYVILASRLASYPNLWQKYSAPGLRLALGVSTPEGEYSAFRSFELIDISAGKSARLLDSPLDYFPSVAWAPDSRSVILSGVYLPLDDKNLEINESRRDRSFTVEINVLSGALAKVSDDNMRVERWNNEPNELVLERAEPTSYDFVSRVVMRKISGQWRKEGGHDTVDSVLPEIVLEENINLAPKIYAIDPNSRKKVQLLDLNPEFRQLTTANVEEITWRAKDGHEVKGGLFYPIDYVRGMRYPLVIQTHGWWGPKRFRLDGPWSADYAAQPLAGRGIMVLQAEEEAEDDLAAMAKYMDTPLELPRSVGVYEAVIDLLDEKGLIDRNRVGIIGFSRTCAYVKNALTHSAYHFAAAVVMDGVDAGYFQYVAFAGQTAREDEMLNGGVPYGAGLQAWIERSPSFSIDRVNSPLLILAPNPTSLLGEWEWFAALSHLEKPVELLTMEDGLHELEKPLERKSVQERVVDWFVFWLKNEEEADPDKHDQYERWHRLLQLRH